MKKQFLVLLMATSLYGFSQVGIGTTTPDESSILEISSTTKGFLIPRMTTTQRLALGTGTVSGVPPIGIQVYDTTTNSFWYYNGSVWVTHANTTTGNTIYNSDGAIGTNRLVWLTDTVSFDFNTFHIDGTNDNVGIGTNAPSTKFEISDGADALGFYHPLDNVFAIQTLLDSQTLSDYTTSPYGGDNNKLLLLPLAGYVGIGTTTPTATLHVEGTVKLESIPDNTVTTAINTLVADADGNVYKVNSAPQTLADSAVITWDIANGYNASVTLGDNRVLYISNTPIGSYGTLKVIQDATGSRTLTFVNSSKIQSGSGVGNSPTLSITPTTSDILSFYYDGTTYFWTVGKDFN